MGTGRDSPPPPPPGTTEGCRMTQVPESLLHPYVFWERRQTICPLPQDCIWHSFWAEQGSVEYPQVPCASLVPHPEQIPENRSWLAAQMSPQLPATVEHPNESPHAAWQHPPARQLVTD